MPTRKGNGERYNAACNACRKSRVKCRGGMPCERCANAGSTCVYSVSKRRGRRKTTRSATPYETLFLNQLDSLPGFSTEESSFDALNFTPELSWLYTESPDLLLTVPPICSQGCYNVVHAAAKTLTAILFGEAPPLDQLLVLVDEAAAHAAQYLGCTACDEGCPRLMNLATLYQKQVDVLCGVAEGDEGPVVYMGVFQASDQEARLLKRRMVCRVATKVGLGIALFHDMVKGFEDRRVAGTLDLSNAGRMNLQWLFGASSDLVKRIDCVIDEWAED